MLLVEYKITNAPMYNSTKIAAKKLHDFFRPYKKHLGRSDGEKIFSFAKGIIEGKTVQMCEAGRFSEKEISPKTYCTKISETIGKIDHIPKIHLSKLANKHFKYFIIDESDIQKRYAKKIHCIEKVRDGSTGEVNGQGYPLIAVIGVTEEDEYIPLILRRYSEIQKARIKCVEDILRTFGIDCGAIWILDRGFDDKKFIAELLEKEQQFIIRLDRNGGERSLEVRGVETEKFKISELTAHMGKIGYRRAYMPGRNEELTLIHYSHGKKEPLAVLTTLSPKTSKEAKSAARLYLNRWKIEDYLLFIKQRFNLEKMMVQLPRNVDGLLSMVLVLSHFIMKETFEIEKGELEAAYRWWRKRENADICWSSVARFYRFLFSEWNLTGRNLRTSHSPPNPLQLRLIHS